MCQIFAGTSRQIRGVLLDTYGLLDDLYQSNPDGLGAMYPSTKHGLRTRKSVPHTLADAERFIRELPDDDRNLVLHFRMRTSGHVDRHNAHPFDVLPRQMAMTHNGVLSISTKSDETKCDTRHYIERVLRPQLERFPELVVVDEWRQLVGEDIGKGNRFVFMDRSGEMYFVNRHTGVEHDGMWIANTYSFDAGLLIPEYRTRPKSKGWGGYGRYDYAGFDYDDLGFYGKGGIALPQELDSHDVDMDVDYAIAQYDVDLLAALIEEAPCAVLTYLFNEYYFDPAVDLTELAAQDARIVDLLVGQDIVELTAQVRFNSTKARHIAEVCCYYGDWIPDDIPSDEEAGADVDTTEAANEMYAA